jgi:hypothetical protein
VLCAQAERAEELRRCLFLVDGASCSRCEVRECSTRRTLTGVQEDGREPESCKGRACLRKCARSVRGVPSSNGRGSCGPSEEEVATEKQTRDVRVNAAASTQPIATSSDSVRRKCTKMTAGCQQEKQECLPAQQQPTPLLSYSDGACHGVVAFRKGLVN